MIKYALVFSILFFSIDANACNYKIPFIEIEKITKGESLDETVYDCKEVRCVCVDNIDINVMSVVDGELVLDAEKVSAKAEKERIEEENKEASMQALNQKIRDAKLKPNGLPGAILTINNLLDILEAKGILVER